VDGSDVLAVIQAAAEAVARARAGDGPTLIDVHFDGVSDPVQRLRDHLQRRGLWSAEREAELGQQQAQALADAERQANEAGAPVVDSMFDDVYETPSWNLDEQRRYLLAQERSPARTSGG
jgi:TPP-dependent pyruvate/acetoin dehydrogenase alpha subunit